MDRAVNLINFIFIRQNHNEGFYSFRLIRRMFAYKGSFEFDLITLIDRQFDAGQTILCGEKKILNC